jgi:hypothetical protein
MTESQQSPRARVQAMMRRFAAVAMLVGSCLGAAPAHANLIGTEQRATPLSAFRGMAVWSTYVQRANAYRLRFYANGVTRTLRVPAREVPFDADLGRDRRGRTVITYSRCRREPEGGIAQRITPSRVTGGGCDIYEYRLSSSRERRLATVSTRHASEYLPTMYGRTLVFVRRHPKRPGAAGRRPHLRRFDLVTRREHALPGGTIGFYGNAGTRAAPQPVGGPGPGLLDLRNRRLIVGWEFVNDACGDFSLIQASEVWMIDTSSGEQSQLVGGTCEGDLEPMVFSPTLDDHVAIYVRRRGTEVLVRRDLGTGSIDEARGYAGAVSVSGGAGALFVVRRVPAGGLRVERTAPTFGPTGG